MTTRYDSTKNEILSDDADLLREFAAARGVRVHDDRVRRDRALQAHVRLRCGVPHGHRRARREYRARRGEAGNLARRAGGPQSEDFSSSCGSCSGSATRISFARRRRSMPMLCRTLIRRTLARISAGSAIFKREIRGPLLHLRQSVRERHAGAGGLSELRAAGRA